MEKSYKRDEARARINHLLQRAFTPSSSLTHVWTRRESYTIRVGFVLFVAQSRDFSKSLHRSISPKVYPAVRTSIELMASSASKDEPDEGVEFIHEDDGSVTARDRETGLARGGTTRSEALSQLAEVLELHEGGGDPIDDPDEFLDAELDIDSDGLSRDRELPKFLK